MASEASLQVGGEVGGEEEAKQEKIESAHIIQHRYILRPPIASLVTF